MSPEGPPDVRLFREDCRTGLAKELVPGSVDVVVTSPPYNLGVRYTQYDDRLPREEYLRFLGEVRDALDRVLAPEGSIFLNFGGTPKEPFLPWEVAGVFRARFALQNVIHWVKSIAIDRRFVGGSAGLDRDLAIGHYKPMASDRYLHGAHEYIFHWTRTGEVPIDRLALGVPYQDKSNVARWRGSGSDRRCRGNTWFLPYETIRRRASDRPHPASFPPELPEWCLRLHGLGKVRLALDPFVGIGSTAVAAVRLGIPFVGFDLDEEYLAVARARVAAEARPSVPHRAPRSMPGSRRRRSTQVPATSTAPGPGG